MKSVLLFSITLLAATAAWGEWNIQEPDGDTSKPLTGEIWGKPFELKEAVWNDVTLTLASDKRVDGWPESEVLIFMFDVNPGNAAVPTEWVFTSATDSFETPIPHVHMRFAKPGQQFSGAMAFTNEYAMRLKLVEKSDTQAQFEIHLSLPDYKKSYLIGQFVAQIQN